MMTKDFKEDGDLNLLALNDTSGALDIILRDLNL
jgi:hypothetical protein